MDVEPVEPSQFLRGLAVPTSLVYEGGESPSDNALWGNVNLDWTRDTESCRSTSGYVLILNSAVVAVAIGIYEGDVI